MKCKKTFAMCLFLLMLSLCSCGKATYDFRKMEKALHKENGEDYSIEQIDDSIRITRTSTFPKYGRSAESLANLTQEEFDEWAKNIWFVLCNEQNDYEKVFADDGNEYDVSITYLIRDADGHEIGKVNADGCQFTLQDLAPYRTVEDSSTSEMNGEMIEQNVDSDFVDVECATLNTYYILQNYLSGSKVMFDTVSLNVMAENIDEVMASDWVVEKPLSINNDGSVLEMVRI